MIFNRLWDRPSSEKSIAQYHSASQAGRWGDYLREIPIPYSKDDNFPSFLLLVLRRIAFLPHGLTTHLDAMSVVNETI